MARKHKTRQYGSITETLRQAILQGELNFRELERETGVKRQSLMKFSRGEQSLRLDMADKLAEFFGLELTAAIRSRTKA
jgi:transcriptional regulator with XRE-family HTH domain